MSAPQAVATQTPTRSRPLGRLPSDEETEEGYPGFRTADQFEGTTGAEIVSSRELTGRVAKEAGIAPAYLDVLRATICKDLNEPELALYLTYCARRRLDPFSQMAVWKSKKTGEVRWTTRIDGLRALAARSGKFRGRTLGLLEETVDGHKVVIGAWCEVYHADYPDKPVRAEVLFKEFNTGERVWQTAPEVMIKKVAESHAIRAAFPDETGGIYTPEELP